MVRVHIKGGVWKNTEDEILKAAISKYGMNQWARISSLLTRKTPKQCKARWYEWLDPSIKKTEWSKEEDEKLLHLAKLMPTQWRTIAPIVGRTTTQCIDRYQRLLDDAEEQDGSSAAGAAAGPSSSSLSLTGLSGPEAAPSADDVRRLRPGEIDPDPESKPARPDPIDMDEDEKEMLSEARARLANTQGKKAKRKERERALEEARRLALLQKRRELKAAGIVMRGPKAKKGEVDYSADIPFEKQPARGFYDTSEESSRSYQTPIGKTLAEVDRKRKTRLQEEDADAARKKRQQQSKESQGAFSAEKAEQLRKLKEAEQISKRRKLELPDAQVGESELEEIVKLGQAGESARDLVAAADNEASEGLLGSYDALERAKMARTPQVAREDDTVMREARNLRNMTAAQTPLLGEDNAPEYGPESERQRGRGRDGSAVAQTPNPLARSSTATPAGPGATPFRTPFRDHIGLNDADAGSSVAGTPFDDRRARMLAKRELVSGLRGLPAPKNDFELVLDDEDDGDDGEAGGGGGDKDGHGVDVDVDVDEDGKVRTTDADDDSDSSLDDISDYITISEDAADRDARMARAREEARRREMARRSRVVQRGLPRPADVNEDELVKALQKNANTPHHVLIAREMAALIKHDSVAHPIAGGRSVGGGAKSSLPVLDDAVLTAARAEVHEELARAVGFPGASEDVVRRFVGAEEADKGVLDEYVRGKAGVRAQAAVRKDGGEGEGSKAVDADADADAADADIHVWSATSSRFVPRSTLSATEITHGQRSLLDDARRAMTSHATSAAKEEKRLAKLLGGYMTRSAALSAAITHAHTALSESAISHAAFERLAAGEAAAIAERVDKLSAEVRALDRREEVQQARYAELDRRRREVREQVQRVKDERDMRVAERLNEQAMEADGEDDGDADDAEGSGGGGGGGGGGCGGCGEGEGGGKGGAGGENDAAAADDEDGSDSDDEVGPPAP